MKKYYILGILLIAGGIAIFSQSPGNPALAEQNKQNAEIFISLSIDGLYKAETVAAQSGETLLSLMERLNTTDPNFSLKTKEYSGLGVLIEGIGKLQNGTENKYWQYTVNGIAPQIGADKFTLSNNDKIEWLFKTYDQ
jgi:hypothetical protein